MIKKILLYLALVLILGSVFLPQFFIKVKVVCKSQYGECPAETISKFQSLNFKSIFQVKNGIKKVLKDDRMISSYSSQYKIPNTLLVNVLVRKPTFAFKDQDTGNIYLVDDGGSILSIEKSTNLPLVIQQGSEPNLFALNLIKGVYEMYNVSVGKVVDDSLTVELPGGIKVIFPLEGDSEVLLGSLRLIYTKITSGESIIYYQIDLRFKNPVLR